MEQAHDPRHFVNFVEEHELTEIQTPDWNAQYLADDLRHRKGIRRDTETVDPFDEVGEPAGDDRTRDTRIPPLGHLGIDVPFDLLGEIDPIPQRSSSTPCRSAIRRMPSIASVPRPAS